jgi:hypothetical protein
MIGLTRRRILLSATALVGAGLSTSAEAANGAISLHVVSGGLIVGVGGGSGVLRFRASAIR